jgi:uncharacterized membrane protein YkoI
MRTGDNRRLDKVVIGVKSENATANRMANQATETVAETVQDIVEEVSETHGGKDPEEIQDAVQEKWAEKQGDAAPPLPPEKAAEYAEHISEGNDVTVVPATQEPKQTTTGSDPRD